MDYACFNNQPPEIKMNKAIPAILMLVSCAARADWYVINVNPKFDSRKCIPTSKADPEENALQTFGSQNIVSRRADYRDGSQTFAMYAHSNGKVIYLVFSTTVKTCLESYDSTVERTRALVEGRAPNLLSR